LDLNADLGESFGTWTMGDDAAMLPLVTSASVACGLHAGDPVTMLDTCREAYELDVRVGAHLGYPDLAGFGLRAMDITFDDLFGAAPNSRFENGAWQFLLLDTTEGNSVFRTRISNETLQWVRGATRALDRKKPTLVLTHFPLGRNWLRPVNAGALLDSLGADIVACWQVARFASPRTWSRGITICRFRSWRSALRTTK